MKNSQTFQLWIVYFSTLSELQIDKTCKLWPWNLGASTCLSRSEVVQKVLPEHRR